jgi:GNAT superfamily N-acetyltransferase
MIIPYQDSYFEDVCLLCEEYSKEYSKFNNQFNLDFRRARELAKDNCFLMFKDSVLVGILGGVVINSLLSDDLIFQEVIFYVKPEYRKYSKELLKYMELHLKDIDVNLMAMNAPSSDNIDIIGRFYNIQGFKELERIYLKRLQ